MDGMEESTGVVKECGWMGALEGIYKIVNIHFQQTFEFP